jgi:thiol:disulfide interchange protein
MHGTSEAMARLHFIWMTLVALLVASAAVAQPKPHMAVSLAAERVDTAAQAVTLAVVMRPEPGWHGYWKNPGEAGVETQAAWTLPAGVSAGPLQYPVPQTLLVGGIMNYVYEGDHALLVDLKLPQGLAAGRRLPVGVKLDYLVCTKEICVPESATVKTEIVVGAPGADLARWRAAMPRPLSERAAFAVEGGKVRIGVPLPATASAEGVYFFPLAHKVLDYAAPQIVSREGDQLTIETKLADGASPAKIDGVLRLGAAQGLSLSATPGAVAAAAPDGRWIAAAFAALGGAILGGLILNVMPCVFPIVSLKALSLAKAGGDEGKARREALAYAAGVIATCVALGAIILGARAAGASLGWAFQLQNPAIVFVLLLLATAITLALAGFVSLPGFGGGQVLVERGGTQGAFWTGVLAAFVATPCTGPFMATALGAALVLPPVVALAIFAGLGLGLALPFLAIGYIPALRRMIPRPGPWMATFQRLLAIPMALTVVALLWLIDRAQGAQAFQMALIGVVIVSALAIGLNRRKGERLPVGITASLAAVLLAGAVLIKVPSLVTGPPPPPPTPFSEAMLAQARAAGKPVFVYFTADWCLTCKVNERNAIATDAVRDAFAAKGTVVLEGDWTDGDAAITRFLNANGAFGVPLYLYYPAGGGEPKVLPQLLTVGTLTGLGG